MADLEHMQQLINELIKLSREHPINSEDILSLSQPDVCSVFINRCQTMQAMMGSAVVSLNMQIAPLKTCIQILKSHRKTLLTRLTQMQQQEIDKTKRQRQGEGISPVGSEDFNEQVSLIEADLEALMEGKPRVLDPTDIELMREQEVAIANDPSIKLIREVVLKQNSNPFKKSST